MKSLTLGISMMAMLVQATCCQGESIILIKPTAGWSVTGKDDVQQLKHLASGVGWEFEPNADTMAGLKRIGIKTIRCINVDPLPGQFDTTGKFVVSNPDRLLGHLKTCREIGANPHIIIAQGVHPDLRLKVEDIPESQRGVLGNQTAQNVFGPKDWDKFQKYCQAYFEYILITQSFPQAEFEVANEPDIGGGVHPFPPKPAMGSRALYEGYFNLYKNVALAAQDFERAHSGVKVKLGGPALAWAFTFKFGDFNWAERFLRDCGEQKVKLDFVGLHYYGNISSLDGEYSSNFPAFTQMLKTTQTARDRYCPGVPLCMTEWGPSYETSNSPSSAVNGNHIGAAWSAAFLNAMLQGSVEGALYLVTTDLRQQTKDGKWEDVWGWPSLFVNPIVFGPCIPKAPYHVFDMISRLEGHRVEATRGSNTVNGFASADKEKKRITLLIWNYGYRIPEFGIGAENAQREAVTVRVREAAQFFGSRSVKVERWQISESMSDAYSLFIKGERLDQRAALQKVDSGSFAIVDDTVDIGFAMPPSSVSFVTLAAD